MDSVIDYGDHSILVLLGFNVGDTFESFNEFKEKLEHVSRVNFVRFWRRDSRTIEGARKKTKRFLNPDLEFYQLRYSCFYARKHHPKVSLRGRKRRSLTQGIETACPASISLKVSNCGGSLEVCSVIDYHNHAVNQEEYQKIKPKEKDLLENLMEECNENVIIEDVTNVEDKYKVVLTKCRQIARIASVSNPKEFRDIIKNLDDYIFYLKYNLANKNDLNNSELTLPDENIKIIVE